MRLGRPRCPRSGPLHGWAGFNAIRAQLFQRVLVADLVKARAHVCPAARSASSSALIIARNSPAPSVRAVRSGHRLHIHVLAPRPRTLMSPCVLCAGFWTPAITRHSARSASRRPKSAKARSRGKLGRGDAASYGIWLAGLIRSQATKFLYARLVAWPGHNFSVMARSLIMGEINLGLPHGRLPALFAL
jgi:hypothetical protein